jgi:hypothetical protein
MVTEVALPLREEGTTDQNWGREGSKVVLNWVLEVGTRM